MPKISRRIEVILLRKFSDLKKCRRKYDPMRILEAIFYLLRSGCQWRLLPPCYPHWKSVYNKWRYWNAIGIFLRILSFLIRYSRNRSGRNEMPAICFIDSASRRSGLSDSVKGIDGFKKIKGIKMAEARHSFRHRVAGLLNAPSHGLTTVGVLSVIMSVNAALPLIW